MSDLELSVESVGKRYGRSWALRGVTFTLSRGVFGLLGRNGAGKSTLLRIIATASRPDEGRILWRSEPVARRPAVLRRVLGYLPQEFGTYPRLTAREFLRYMAALKGLSGRMVRTRVDEILALVGLSAEGHRALGGYSKGMRQRVGIAQALLNDPLLLVVDEPTAGLDPEERAEFRNLLVELAADRVVALSTHIVSDVATTASRIGILHDGRLIAIGPPEELIERVRGRVWRLELSSSFLPELRRTHVVTALTRAGDDVRVRVVADAPPAGATAQEASLEDAYLSLVRE